MIVTKGIYNKVFYYMDHWGENLACIAWEIREYCCHILNATPGKAVFVRYIIFNLVPIFDRKVTTYRKQRKFYIDKLAKMPH